MTIESVSRNSGSNYIKTEVVEAKSDYSKLSSTKLLRIAENQKMHVIDRTEAIKILGMRAKKGATDLYIKINSIANAGNSFIHSDYDDNADFLKECIKILANDNNANAEKHLAHIRNMFGVFKPDFPKEARGYASKELARIDFKKHATKDLSSLKRDLNKFDDAITRQGKNTAVYFNYSYDHPNQTMGKFDFGLVREALFLTGRVKDVLADQDDLENAIHILELDYNIKVVSHGISIGHKTIQCLISEISR